MNYLTSSKCALKSEKANEFTILKDIHSSETTSADYCSICTEHVSSYQVCTFYLLYFLKVSLGSITLRTIL